MKEYLAIAVLLPAAADQHHRRERLSCPGIGERTLEVDAVSVAVHVVGHDGLLVEAVGWLRCLWAAQLVESVGGMEGDLLTQDALPPVALPGVRLPGESGLESYAFALDAEGIGAQAPLADGDGVEVLQGAEELQVVAVEVQAQRQPSLLAPSRPPLRLS